MQNQKIKPGYLAFKFESRVQGDLVERTIFPLQKMVFGRLRPGSGQREFLEGQFGLVPPWVKDDKGGTKFGRHCYNARSETIFEKPSFRKPILNRRALILVNAFFEYADETSDNRLMKIVRKDGGLIPLAGIWENHPGYGLDSCSIITTEPMELLKGLHSRSPLVLDQSQVDSWLDPAMGSRDAIQSFLKPGDSSALAVAS